MVDVESLVTKTLEKGMTVWVEYDLVPGFKVEIAFLDREELQKMIDRCTRREWSRTTRRVEEVLNRDKLRKLYAERVIKNWKGLKVKDLTKFVPLDLDESTDPQEEVECTLANKEALIKHSLDFDNWLMEIAMDPENFNEVRKITQEQTENLKQ